MRTRILVPLAAAAVTAGASLGVSALAAEVTTPTTTTTVPANTGPIVCRGHVHHRHPARCHRRPEAKRHVRAAYRDDLKWGDREAATFDHLRKFAASDRTARLMTQQRQRADQRARRERRYQRYLDAITPPGPDTLAAIRACESGSSGGYSANTGNGFYGAYQFTLETWRSVGGTVRPDLAPPREQDKRAAALYRREGPSPWPVCGV